MKLERATGVLLHPTSLPGRFGVGDLGKEAYRYLEWLSEAGVTWWQVLPTNPPGPGESPYAAISTFAGNPLLISPELLLEDGLLTREDLATVPVFPDYAVAFEAVVPTKETLLRKAWASFQRRGGEGLQVAFAAFAEANAVWLHDYALFAAAKKVYGDAEWSEWPGGLAGREPGAVASWRAAHEQEVRFEEFCQFLFARQWSALRAHARSLGVKILGDLPIFVAYDSADVWAHRELFRLDASGQPVVVAGVPPDYFSETGQLWGNPLYDWEHHASTGYRWWVDRLRAALQQVDALRLDHFRGFAAYWEVPGDAETAMAGRWVKGPGRSLFETIQKALGDLPLVAEDLGVITPDVEALRDDLGLPGMAVLQFGFSPDPRGPFLPYCHRSNLVVYTGTHDNNTTLGWLQQEASIPEQDLLRRYASSDAHEVSWDMIRLALSSVARLAVIPHQDLAGLGADCRMNTPGVASGNWRFRITPWMLSDSLRDRLAGLNWTYGRSPLARQAHRPPRPVPGYLTSS
jgi:4-alpha-glucanotransferase